MSVHDGTGHDEDVAAAVAEATDVPMFDAPPEHVPSDTGSQTPIHEAGSIPVDGDAPGANPETPAYEPDFGYQIRGEQFTFDERLHSAVKDKDTEDFLRDTFTKAHGLDAVKTRLDESETKYGDLQSQFNESRIENDNFRGSLEHLNKLKESDPLGFQRQWGLSDKWVLDRATSILDHQDNPAQGQLAEQAYNARNENYQNQQSMTRESARTQSMERELHDVKMSQAMNHGEISDFAKSYDVKMGAGAFKAQVDDFGSLQYHQGQRYVDPQVAVAEVYGKLQKMWTPDPASPVSLNSGAAAPAQARPRAAMPNMGGGMSGTPTTKRFNTLADLRAHAAALAAQS
jgi:hypothetical protein